MRVRKRHRDNFKRGRASSKKQLQALRRRKSFRQRGGTTLHPYNGPNGSAAARRLRQIERGQLRVENGLTA